MAQFMIADARSTDRGLRGSSEEVTQRLDWPTSIRSVPHEGFFQNSRQVTVYDP
jgi:hypothetical protein